jgi:hypothetical protein
VLPVTVMALVEIAGTPGSPSETASVPVTVALRSISNAAKRIIALDAQRRAAVKTGTAGLNVTGKVAEPPGAIGLAGGVP